MQYITHVFNRHEIKYMITQEQYRKLLDGIRDYMLPDPHGESTICNIYYDTPDDRLVRKSLEGPVYKEKIRLRSYGTAKDDSIVFLELKKKYQGIVYKRRIELPEHAASDYMKGTLSFQEMLTKMHQGSSPQIAEEIEQFKHFYHDLRPAVYLSYDRSAFFSEEDDSLRITFDDNIRWRKERMSLTEDAEGELLLSPDIYLLEIKTAESLPLWLVSLLSRTKIRPSGFSKYGRVFQTVLTRGAQAAASVVQDKKQVFKPACSEVLPIAGN